MTTLTQLTGWLMALGIPKDDGYLEPAANGETRRCWVVKDHPTWWYFEPEPDDEDQAQVVAVRPIVDAWEQTPRFRQGQVIFSADWEGAIENVRFWDSTRNKVLGKVDPIPNSLPELQGLFELFRLEWIKYEEGLSVRQQEAEQ